MEAIRGGDSGRLDALENVAADILSHLDLEGTLLSVLNAVVELTRADIAGILLAAEDDDALHMRACTGHRTVETAKLVVHRGQGVAGKVFETGRPVRVDDYQADPSISRDFVDIAQADGTRSALGAPLTVRGEVIGVAMSWRRRPALFTEDELRALTTLANLAAIAVENARLYEAERRTVSGLRKANQRLEEQNEILQRATDVHRELTRLVLGDAGMAELVALVARLLDADVTVFDADGSVLAASGAAGEALNERVSARIAADARGNGRAAAHAPDDGRLLVREVVAGGELLAHLGVALRRRPAQLDTVGVEQAAIVCALALTRERAVLEARTRVRADFLWDLIGGKIRDQSEAIVWARALRFTFPDVMRLLLVRAEGRPEGGTNDAGEPPDAALRESLALVAERAATAATGNAALAARRGSIIALLVPGNDDPATARAHAEAVLGRLRERWPWLELSAGVSGSVASAQALPEAYAQARAALSAAPIVAGGTAVAVLDELGVLRFLLAPGDRGDLQDFARRVLGPVVDYDSVHPSELTETVEAYLAADCSLQRTAERMFVHPKTVRYRLDRVQEMAGLDFARQRDRFDAQLALSIVRTFQLQGVEE